MRSKASAVKEGMEAEAERSLSADAMAWETSCAVRREMGTATGDLALAETQEETEERTQTTDRLAAHGRAYKHTRPLFTPSPFCPLIGPPEIGRFALAITVTRAPATITWPCIRHVRSRCRAPQARNAPHALPLKYS